MNDQKCENCKHFKENKETLFDWIEGECKLKPKSVFKFGDDYCAKHKTKKL